MITDKDKARFWAKVIVGRVPECWTWTGANDGRGYGQFYLNGRQRRATQVSWEIENERPFPPGLHCCHSCDNPRCVNPHHLWPGTPSENALDAVAKGRVIIPWDLGVTPHNALKTHCIHGHEFTPENTLRTHGGKRECRICKRFYQARYKRKLRQSRAALNGGCSDG